jgi:hypothetical protein
MTLVPDDRIARQLAPPPAGVGEPLWAAGLERRGAAPADQAFASLTHASGDAAGRSRNQRPRPQASSQAKGHPNLDR